MGRWQNIPRVDQRAAALPPCSLTMCRLHQAITGTTLATIVPLAAIVMAATVVQVAWLAQAGMSFYCNANGDAGAIGAPSQTALSITHTWGQGQPGDADSTSSGSGGGSMALNVSCCGWTLSTQLVLMCCTLVVASMSLLLKASQRRTQHLICAMLPEQAIQQLSMGKTYTESFQGVSILFAE